MPVPARSAIRPEVEREPGFLVDDRGQVLVLCGVLLVLGFVVVGSTIIQMQALDESTARVQRTEISEPTSHAIDGFEAAVRRTVTAGETNMTDFLERTTEHESLATSNAVGRGLYMAVVRDENPTQEFIVAHCGGYHAGRSANGVIVGYTKNDLRESIVGSAYFMHITDGSRTMRWHHYVSIHECSDKDVKTYPEEVAVSLGAAGGDLTNVRVKDDGALEFSIKEQLDGEAWTTEWPGFRFVTAKNWAPSNGPNTDGGLAASHTGVLVGDYYRFNLTMPQGMLPTAVAKVKLRIDASHTPQVIPPNDDLLKLSMHTATTNTTSVINVQPGEQSFIFEPLSPSGNGHWTYTELKQTNWTIWVHETLAKDATRVYKVDYINTTVEYTTPLGHNMNSVFTWVDIPDIYGDHKVNITYKLAAHPANEVFLLEVYDTVADEWDLVETIRDTGGLWYTPPDPHFQLVSPDHYERTGVNQPIFRIRNDPAFVDDNLPGDLDTIYFDFFALDSTADNDP